MRVQSNFYHISKNIRLGGSYMSTRDCFFILFQKFLQNYYIIYTQEKYKNIQSMSNQTQITYCEYEVHIVYSC